MGALINLFVFCVSTVKGTSVVSNTYHQSNNNDNILTMMIAG